MNQSRKKIYEMQQKKWWSYALLAAGMFVFTEGCTMLKTNTGSALSAIVLSLFMHSSSMKDLGKRLLKHEPGTAANIAMVLVLILAAAVSYFREITLSAIFLMNVSAVLVFLIAAAASKFIKKQ
jgi:Mg/Co/Ni transporter MgtE